MHRVNKSVGSDTNLLRFKFYFYYSTSHVTLGKLLNISVPQIPSL